MWMCHLCIHYRAHLCHTELARSARSVNMEEYLHPLTVAEMAQEPLFTSLHFLPLLLQKFRSDIIVLWESVEIIFVNFESNMMKVPPHHKTL